MKKVLSIITIALFTATFVACGPSKEEKEKMEANAKRITDSITDAISKSMSAAPETATTEAAATESAATTETAAAEAKH